MEDIAPFVIIEIRGLANTGKTTLALAIKELLIDRGISNVAVNDGDVSAGRSNNHLQERRLKSLVDRSVTVLIETSQVVRP